MLECSGFQYFFHSNKTQNQNGYGNEIDNFEWKFVD